VNRIGERQFSVDQLSIPHAKSRNPQVSETAVQNPTRIGVTRPRDVQLRTLLFANGQAQPGHCPTAPLVAISRFSQPAKLTAGSRDPWARSL